MPTSTIRRLGIWTTLLLIAVAGASTVSVGLRSRVPTETSSDPLTTTSIDAPLQAPGATAPTAIAPPAAAAAPAAVAPVPATAAPLPAAAAPVSAPAAPAPPGAEVEDRPRTNAGIINPNPPINALPAADTAPSEVLRKGLDALFAGDLAAARAIRNGLPLETLDRQILTWAIGTSGDSGLLAEEIAAAQRELPDWPGMGALSRHRERALYREKAEPDAVLRTFAGSRPQTLHGVLLLARAHRKLGNEAGARAVLLPLWHKEKLGAGEEARILAEFGGLISASDHRIRMERMLYQERVTAANRIAELGGAKQLANAWGAAIRNDKSAAKLLKAVPADQRTAGYDFIEAKRLRRAKKYDEAAALILKAPTDKAALVDPDAWWTERRVLSRELLDLGNPRTAYQLAATHSAETPVNAADAEFHAGWYALRGLRDAKVAAEHFDKLARLAEGPITSARAYYWLGRAAEAGGPGDAKLYFQKAAAYGTTFYGQLAAERIGGRATNIAVPAPSAADRAAFEGRQAVRAIRRLERTGFIPMADRLYRELAAELASPGELALLAGMAEQRGNHFLALKVGKIASSRGIDIGALSHPIGAIPSSADLSTAGRALAYAIARQESEFNPGAVSGAGARGLLQLLPGTAKEVAEKIGLDYSKPRLTSDPGYNATLGAAFLGEQLGRFDGSYVLTFVGYNAGPGRARQWIRKYGDPRGKDIDAVVDWIERIPFTETRTYVQRVMENYQVYKMRLSGKFDIVGDLVAGR